MIHVLSIRRRQSTSTLSSSHGPPGLITSAKWLSSERLGNVDTLVSKSDIENLISVGADANGAIANIIGETVCSPDSPVARLPPLSQLSHESLADDNSKGRHLAAQLVYSAMHEMQYGPARNEAKWRVQHWDLWESQYSSRPASSATSGSTGTNDTTRSITNGKTGVGRLDFECPTAKFLVVEHAFTTPVGFGSSLRTWGNVPPLRMAMAHGRVLLYHNDESNPVSCAGCSRRDLQCSFLPVSPCVITREEYDSAPRVKPSDLEMYLLQRHNTTDNDRVIVTGRGTYRRTKKQRREWKDQKETLIGSIERTVVELFVSASMGQERFEDQRDGYAAAVRDILSRDYDDMSMDAIIDCALHLFISRPNRKMRLDINEGLAHSFPEDYDPTRAIGMPIRASDKCLQEEKCITFDEYMGQLHSKFDLKHGQTYRHVILTSEDSAIIEASRDYATTKNGIISFSFITNDRDVMQGHGLGLLNKKQIAEMEKVTSKEAVMTSTMTAWAFQLRAGLSFLNLCSNFHILIDEAIRFGCSSGSGPAHEAVVAQNVDCRMSKVLKYKH